MGLLFACLVTVLTAFLFDSSLAYYYRIPVGVIVGKDDDAYLTAINYAVSMHESNASKPYTLKLIVEKIDNNDIYQVDKAVCKIMNQGVFVIMAPTTFATYTTLASYSNNFHVPLISPSFPEIPLDQSTQFGIAIQPSPIRATLDLMRYNNWNSIIYLYDSEDGAENFQKILLFASDVFQVNIIGMHRVTSAEDAILYIRKIDIANRQVQKQVLLKMNPNLISKLITLFLHDYHINKNKFSFLFMEPVLNDFWENNSVTFASINMLGFRLVNPVNERYMRFKNSWKYLNADKSNATKIILHDVPKNAILGYDGVLLLLKTIDNLLQHQNPNSRFDISSILNGTRKHCFQSKTPYWHYGQVVSQYLKETTVPMGLTGSLKFDSLGGRQAYSLDIIETFPTGHDKVATWSDAIGLRKVTRSLNSHLQSISPRLRRDEPVIVTSILAPPFLMKKSGPCSGNDCFEGYCKDLANDLMQQLELKYKIQLVADGTYGRKAPGSQHWSGMIGEVIDGRAALAIAPLTVTSKRSKVVHFSIPFQTIGISLMIKKPGSWDSNPLGNTPFFFLYVFTKEVWICIIVTYVVITALLFFVTKFTGPPDRAKDYEISQKRKLTICSTVWFTMGSFLLRGTGIYPKSISSRVLSCIWWAFTLTIISLYIANAATILVSHRLGAENSASTAAISTRGIQSILEDAVNSGIPELGCVRGGSTEEFFRNSQVPLYKRIYESLQKNPDNLFSSSMEGVERVREKNGKYAIFVETTVNEYINHREPCNTLMVPGTLDTKSYAIASMINSTLSKKIDEVIRNFQESGHLNQLYDKWWIRTSECAQRFSRSLEELYHDSLTIWEISGVFYVLLIGIALVLGISAAEYFYCSRNNSSKRHNTALDETQT